MNLIPRLRRFFDGSMRANAVALVTNQLSAAGLGFLYWLLAARLYPVEVVGISSAMISTVQLVSGIAHLGLANGMQRFLPRAGRHARRLALSAYAVALVAATIAGVAALVIATHVAPGGGVFNGIPAWWIVLAAVLWTLFYLQDGVLIGLRAAVWVLLENSAYNLSKIVLLVAGAFVLTESGIVVSWFAPTPIAIAFVSWLVFRRLLHPERLSDHHDPHEQVTAREIVRSLSADHVGGMVNEAAMRALPLLVVRMVGAEANAYFYQAWMIATVLDMVGSGMVNSFTAETAADRRRVGANSRAILRTMSLILIPAALTVAFAAPLILGIFGPAYAREGTTLLRWLALAVLPVMFSTWYVAYLQVMGHMRRLVGVRILGSVALVGLSYLGLQTIGITGVGVAWFVSQLSIAVYALLSTRAVLRKDPSGETRPPALRRGDWRFLLPVPVPQRTIVMDDGELSRSAVLVGGTVLHATDPAAAESDLAVADRPSAETLSLCHRLLRDGGTCYTEWPKPMIGGVSAITRRHVAAGFSEPMMYWPAPRFGAARLWVRIPTGGAAYHDMLRPLIAGAVKPYWIGRAAGAAAVLMLRLGYVPGVVSVARKPSGPDGAEESADFCAWLELQLRARLDGADDIMILMRTGGTDDDNKVNWLVYGGDGAEVRWIAKAPRHVSSRPALKREYGMLQRLDRRTQESKNVVETPRPVLHTQEAGFPVFVQTAVHGVPLLAFAEQQGYERAAERLSDALATLAGRPQPRPVDEWWDRLVERWLARLESQLEPVGESALVHQVREALAELGPLPLTWAHNDCTPWNTFVTPDGLSMFDWEDGEEYGLPAVDLVYALATTAFSLDGNDSTSRSINTYRRLLDPADSRGRVFREALAQYGDAVGLRATDLALLRIVTWLVHSTHDLHNIFEAAGGPSRALLSRCVCLPILRAEVERRMLLTPGFAAPAAPTAASPGLVTTVAGAPVDALFVSPHLDDAVLSCGSGIARLSDAGKRVLVATVFTGDMGPEEDISPLAQRCHEVWGAGPHPFTLRRDEDCRALSVLGTEHVYLGMHDAVYRTRADGTPLYTASQRGAIPAEDERGYLPLLTDRIAQLLAAYPSAVVFAPGGMGGHVDHVLVRRALEQCAPERLVYYDEYPYLSWTAGVRSHRRLASPTYVLRATPNEIERHVRAAGAYTSQIRGLFPSPVARAVSILRVRLPRACSWLPPAVDSLESARKRMEACVRRDHERFGERYRWQDESWAGPFERLTNQGS